MKRFIRYPHLAFDALVVSASVYLSLFMRVGWEELPRYLPILTRYLFFFVVARLTTFYYSGVYEILWRYVSLKDALKLARAVGISSVIIIAGTYLIDIGRLPRATFFIDALFATLLLTGLRVIRRVAFEYSSKQEVRQYGKNTLIFGAGTNGRNLAHRLETDRHLGFRLMGFIDDDLQKNGRLIDGMRVLGTRRELSQLLERYKVQELILAVTHLPAEILRDIVQTARAFNIRPRIQTDVGKGNTDKKTFKEIETVELHHLLNRPPYQSLNLGEVRRLIEGKCVLVTGAGGSIGSELCRQIFNCNPSRLILLDHSEFNLYQIDKELRVSSETNGEIVPILQDIKDRQSLHVLFERFRPSIVFHSAAYKHVHLVEGNPSAAILNNILGTQNVMNLSAEYAVGTFVLISTDKAVNPVGVMGASKRVCEMLVTLLGTETQRRFCSVRFGNVLGSSGSLVPLLVSQIKNGEPVTVTHEGATRYFMSIQEAVSLVLEAATISRPGDINILRMGEPIKIIDLARSLIALLGKTENETPIVITGLRPGEKLHEELYLSGNEINTEHPDILVLRGSVPAELSSQLLNQSIDSLIGLAQKGNLTIGEKLLALTNNEYLGDPKAFVYTDPEKPLHLL